MFAHSAVTHVEASGAGHYVSFLLGRAWFPKPLGWVRLLDDSRMTKTVLTAVGIGDRDVRIEQEVERLLRMTSWLRECFEGEVSAALGTREKHSIDAKTITKWKELCACFNSLADAKVRLDKASKSLADAKMSPEQTESVVRSYIRSLAPGPRLIFLTEEVSWHQTNV